MNTEWVCFICRSKNSIDDTYCASCGAHRPFAAQAFSVSADEEWEGKNEYSGALIADEENKVLEALESLAAEAVDKELDAKAFGRQINLIFAGLEDTVSRLHDDVRLKDGGRAFQNLDIRLRDAYYIYRLARQQFEMYAPDNKRCLKIGLLLAGQAHEGLKFVAEAVRRQQDADGAENREPLIKTVSRFMEGELDFDSYFDSVCAVDEALQRLRGEGHELYFKALEEAKAFDGRNYSALDAAGRDTAEAVDRWLKAIALLS